MTITINGTTGPHSLSTPGGYGANTAFNVRNTPPQNIQQADIHIAPTLQEIPQNAVGYAREDMKPFDTKQDGKLDADELAQVYGGSKAMADQFLKAYDVNGDNAIDVAESAASVIYSLAPTHLLNTTLQAYAGIDQSAIFSAEQQRELREAGEFLNQHLSTPPKPYSTPNDRNLAEFYAMEFPTFTRETLGGIISGLKLDQIA